MSFREYILESSSRFSSTANPVLFGKDMFVVKEHPELDLQAVCKKIEYYLPNFSAVFCNFIDGIYVGEFKFLLEKQVNAAYEDGAIYVSSTQHDVDDMVDDIVHETAHAVEELAPDMIYGDEEIKREFESKRRYLKDLLKARSHNVDKFDFEESEYNKEFDMFLYQEIGYEPLRSISNGLFIAPYGITSLREYFATGFEEFFMGKRDYLKKLSPALYRKLNYLNEYLDNVNRN